MKSRISSFFILFIVIHLNFIMPVRKTAISGDICIMNNGIHMARHSDNKKIHDHRGSGHHTPHDNRIYEIKMDCNMDMSSSGIYFPGGEHPMTHSAAQTLKYKMLYMETILLPQTKSIEGFTNLPDNPPKFIS